MAKKLWQIKQKQTAATTACRGGGQLSCSAEAAWPNYNWNSSRNYNRRSAPVQINIPHVRLRQNVQRAPAARNNNEPFRQPLLQLACWPASTAALARIRFVWRRCDAPGNRDARRERSLDRSFDEPGSGGGQVHVFRAA